MPNRLRRSATLARLALVPRLLSALACSGGGSSGSFGGGTGSVGVLLLVRAAPADEVDPADIVTCPDDVDPDRICIAAKVLGNGMLDLAPHSPVARAR